MNFSWIQWFREDVGTKILSLGLALFLWVFVHIEERARMILRTTIQLANIPDNLMVTNDLPSEIQLTVEGPRTMLTLLNPRLHPYRIDLKDARAGVMRIQVSPQNLRIPRGVEVVEISPGTILVELKETETARIPIRVKLKGSPPTGYVIANVEIVPPQVEVIAPREVLRNLRFLYTEPLPLEGITGTRTWIVPLELGDLKIKGITTQEVEVTLEIKPRIMEMEISSVSVRVEGGDRSHQVLPAKVRVRLRGPEPALLSYKEQSLKATVVIPGAIPSRGKRLPVTLDLPSQEVSVVEISPPTVLVKPREKPLQ
jgi:YbbR domain-containing protein